MTRSSRRALLDLTLTSRNKGAADEVPMAGVPHHAAASYIARLLAQGHKVAICEQMADPSKTAGHRPARGRAGGDARARHRRRAARRAREPLPVRGRASRPAAPTGPRAARPLDRRALGGDARRRGCAVASSCASIRASPGRRRASTILVDARAPRGSARGRCAPTKRCRRERPAQVLVDVLGEPAPATQRARSRAAALDGGRRAAVASRSAATRGRRCRVARGRAWDPSATLALDEVTQTHLELCARWTAGARARCSAYRRRRAPPPGARLCALAARAALDVAADSPPARRGRALRARTRWPAPSCARRSATVGDLERLGVRAALGEATPTRSRRPARRAARGSRRGRARGVTARRAVARRARAATRSARAVPAVAAELGARARRRPAARARATAASSATASTPSSTRRARSTSNGRESSSSSRRVLRETRRIPSLKLRYTRVFGWYIEVTHRTRKAPEYLRRKQTVAAGERFTSDELDALADSIAHAEERSASARPSSSPTLVRRARRARGAHAQARGAPRRVGRLARARRGRAPRRLRAARGRRRVRLDIEDGRHPVVEQLAAAGRFVPNDVAARHASGERACGSSPGPTWPANRRSCARSRSP